LKRPFYKLLLALALLSTILGACVVSPVPTADTPVVVIAATTSVMASPLPTLQASPTLTATPSFTATPASTSAPNGLPNIPNKPQPLSSTFQGCPPQGDGGDARLNLLKNRIDEGNYVPVTFDAILHLTWPKTTERRSMDTWSAEDAAAIAQYEGIPVVAEGYLFGAKQSGAESTNCHATAADMTDWHVWLTKTAGEDRTHSIVIETTPRIRAMHKWTLAMMEQIAKSQTPVRISGWLFFDPEHPDQILKTRGTIWEIHPIMQIEVQQNGQWVPLDDLAP
jgi:hypothetical protein